MHRKKQLIETASEEIQTLDKQTKKILINYFKYFQITQTYLCRIKVWEQWLNKYTLLVWR
jgi:hypothetical protein